MARSNTMPLDEPKRYNSKAEKPSRSATTQIPPPAKDKFPIPFHHSAPTSSTTPSQASPPRPTAMNRQNSVQTRYMNMLLDLDTIPRLHNILASFFTWILLAGFIIFPGTFTSLSALADDPDLAPASSILSKVKHVPLLYIAAFSSGIGALGMIWLWWRWRSNFVWLLNRIFLPGCLNSFAGLISTLVQVYSQQHGVWSVTAWVTATVTGACMVITGVLFALYNFWILERVKKRHHGDMRRAETGDGDGEGLVEKIGRKVKEPALEPGSVV